MSAVRFNASVTLLANAGVVESSKAPFSFGPNAMVVSSCSSKAEIRETVAVEEKIATI